MTKREARKHSPAETATMRRLRHAPQANFALRASSFFRHSSFVIRHSRSFLLLSFLLFLIPSLPASAARYVVSAQVPPSPQREFRGAWIATVGNINWPSKPGLSTAQQKAELLALLNTAARLKLNAVILQIRPCSDALYPSRLEPWSEYLTGTVGQPPQPIYDPLDFAVTEAHRRGLELHAWFNPYRARHTSAVSPVNSSHISKTRPSLVRPYGKHLWLDPGDPAVRDHSLSVIMDVVRRYDIDGVHFDDYFYPYQERDSSGAPIDFPDSYTYRKYGGKTGLNRADWRRENVNIFIRRAYVSIHGLKPWVKVGISPFGIWRPGNPPQVRGLDAYDRLYADSRKWLANGWLDYCAPQLYWSIAAQDQSFTTLLDWWRAQNPTGRHIWPGLNSSKVGRSGWNPAEIVNQVNAVRSRERQPGEIHWSIGALTGGHAGLDATLASQCYSQPALVPSCSWLATSHPGQPRVAVSEAAGGKLRVAFQPAPREAASRWVIQIRGKDGWTTHILPGNTSAVTLSNVPPQAVAVTLIDRYSIAAPSVVFERRD